MPSAPWTAHVEVEPFRQRWQALGSEEQGRVAVRLDWLTPTGDPDTHRVRRAIGLRTYSGKNGKRHVKQHIGPDLAKRLADAMGLDYWDVGL